MRKKKTESAHELLGRLAESTPNDAVRLLFMENEDLTALQGLDLSLLKEMKRSPNGTVEIKLLDKLEVIRELNELRRMESEAEGAGDSFYAALDKAANAVKEKDEV